MKTYRGHFPREQRAIHGTDERRSKGGSHLREEFRDQRPVIRVVETVQSCGGEEFVSYLGTALRAKNSRGRSFRPFLGGRLRRPARALKIGASVDTDTDSLRPNALNKKHTQKSWVASCLPHSSRKQNSTTKSCSLTSVNGSWVTIILDGISS